MRLDETVGVKAWVRLGLLMLLVLSPCAAVAAGPQWTASWGSAQLKPSPGDSLPSKVFEGATLRQVVHLSAGGARMRLHLSNAFGESVLVLRAVRVGKGKDGVVVHFNGETGVSIPAGAEYVSDPITVSVSALSDVVVSMMIEKAPETLTFHSGARATSFLVRGDHVGNEVFEAPQTFAHWYFLAGVEVEKNAAAVVTFGDSITDGHGATTDGNDRWTDVLARRLAGKVGVVNAGIGGNCILEDGCGRDSRGAGWGI